MYYLYTQQTKIHNKTPKNMKTKSFIMAMAAFLFLLTACGEKKAEQTQNEENQTNAEVEGKVVADADAEEDEDEGFSLSIGNIEAISKVWESKSIKGVAADGKVDIGRIALAFCKEYPKYEPNKAVVNYFENQKKDDEHFQIECDTKNGYIKSMGMFQVTWDMTGCFWKRKNGHSLVAFWMEHGHENNPDLGEDLLVFYDYDPSTDTMTPEPALSKKVEKKMAKFNEYSVALPSEGKDITLFGYTVNYEEDCAESTEFTLRWNGTDFDF